LIISFYLFFRQQASQHDRFGVPISRRAYNWVPQPPPPEDSPESAVARLPCGERSDRIVSIIYCIFSTLAMKSDPCPCANFRPQHINNAMRPVPGKKTTSPKQYDKSKEGKWLLWRRGKPIWFLPDFW